MKSAINYPDLLESYMHKLKSFLLRDVLKNLYHKLVLPYINYNIESWLRESEYVLGIVKILQGKSLGTVFNLRLKLPHQLFLQKQPHFQIR